MRLVLLGAPGCGKGTQSEMLREKYEIPQISTGDMLRAAISAGTPLGEEARARVAAGALVPDEVMLGLVRERLQAPDAAVGFLLDGFPRSIPQAEGLDAMLAEWSRGLEAVIKMAVGKKVLIDRLSSRRICPHCGTAYNVLTRPPQTEGICDRDGSKLILREDDAEATVRRRLNVYEASTAPVIDYYDAHKLLVIVNGEGPVETVFQRICSALETRVGKPA
jgi:adenylate kinase